MLLRLCTLTWDQSGNHHCRGSSNDYQFSENVSASTVLHNVDA